MKSSHRLYLLALALGVLAACAARSADIEDAVDVPVVDVQDDVEGRWSLRLLSPGGQGLRMGFRFGAADTEGWFPVDVDFVFSGDVGLDPARFEGRGRVTDDGLATVLLWQAGDPGAVEFQAEGVLDGNEIHLRHLVWGSHDYLADRDWRMVRTHGAWVDRFSGDTLREKGRIDIEHMVLTQGRPRVWRLALECGEVGAVCECSH